MNPSFRDEPNPYQPPVLATLVERPKRPSNFWNMIGAMLVAASLIAFGAIVFVIAALVAGAKLPLISR